MKFIKKLNFLVVIIFLCILQLSAQNKPAHVDYSVRTPIPRRNLKLDPSGTIYFVAKNGSNQNSGTREQPFLTIQKFADIARPGDVCLVREGIYRETIQPKNGGRTGDPIRYAAYPGEKVTISGTEPVSGEWIKHQGNIYKIKLDIDAVEQLFVDGEMMIEARWPNMTFGQLWERDSWAKAGKGSAYEAMKDPELAKTNIDWTGAVATLNVAHQFHTWTRKVSRHTKGSATFEYVGNMGKLSGTIGIPGHWENDYYYLSGKLEALDIATEWYYDTDNNMLYLWTPDGTNPKNHSVEIKVRENGFFVEDLNEIHLIGFHFFACTFQFENTVHSVVDDCHLLFPTYRRELGDGRTGDPITGMTGSHNLIQNTTLAFTPLSGLAMEGGYNTLRNNLIHDVCWNGSLRYPAIKMTAGDRPNNEWNPTMICGNTVYNAGSAGIGFRHQCYIVEYNYVHHCGLMSHDVAAIYTSGPGSAGSSVRYNWVHNCHPEIENGQNIGLGIRADDQCRNMTVHHNVVWDLGLDAIIMKGEFHKVYNNTTFHTRAELKFGNSIRMDTEPEPYKAWRMDSPLFNEQNAHSLVFNNVTGIIRAEHKKTTPLVNASNVVHNKLDYDAQLNDKSNFDFRPKDGSDLIDGGIAMPGLTDHFEGDAPDIGAYEKGGVNWVPGYQPQKALFYQNVKAYDKLTD